MFTFIAVVATTLPAALPPGDPKSRNWPRDPQSVFKHLDLNGDGKLSREEFARIRENLSEKAKAASRAGELLTEKVFDLMDTNKDQYVTYEEFKKFRDKTAALMKKRKITSGESS